MRCVPAALAQRSSMRWIGHPSPIHPSQLDSMSGASYRVEVVDDVLLGTTLTRDATMELRIYHLVYPEVLMLCTMARCRFKAINWGKILFSANAYQDVDINKR